MVMLITTEAMVFVALLSAYFFVRAGAPHWPLGGIEKPPLERIGLFTAVLLGSTIPVVWAERGIRKGDVRQLQVGLLAGFFMGLAFVAHQFLLEWPDQHFGWRDNAYGSLFYTITGLHGLHVIAGLLMSLVVQAKAWTGRFDAEHHTTVEVFSLYWHFVDAVWVFVFSSLYLSVYWKFG
jgi:heme/copper-type cytochrome/quinol oxidase subunit 3